MSVGVVRACDAVRGRFGSRLSSFFSSASPESPCIARMYRGSSFGFPSDPFGVHQMETSEQALLSFALLASEWTQNAKDVIDTMLLKSKQEVQADLGRHTSHLLACCQDDRIHCCRAVVQSCGDQGRCGCASVVAC